MLNTNSLNQKKVKNQIFNNVAKLIDDAKPAR